MYLIRGLSEVLGWVGGERDPWSLVLMLHGRSELCTHALHHRTKGSLKRCGASMAKRFSLL
jgi:hypothetical protein